MVVTGGAGFIGSNLVELLINSNYDVHVIDNFSTGDRKNRIKKAIYHNLDLSKSSSIGYCTFPIPPSFTSVFFHAK